VACVQDWEVVVLQALKWDVAAVTAGDFVDLILSQLSLLSDVDSSRRHRHNSGLTERQSLVRQHALTFVVLCALGTTTSLLLLFYL